MPADIPAHPSPLQPEGTSGAATETPGQPAPMPDSSYAPWTGYEASYASYPAYPAYPTDPNVGAPPYSYPYPYAGGGYYPWMFWPQAPRLGTWALVSMICGAVSIITFQWIVAVLAVVFGFVGLNEVKKSAGQVEGRGFAIAGVVMGFVSIAINLVIIVLYILYLVVIFSALGGYPG